MPAEPLPTYPIPYLAGLLLYHATVFFRFTYTWPILSPISLYIWTMYCILQMAPRHTLSGFYTFSVNAPNAYYAYRTLLILASQLRILGFGLRHTRP